MAVFSSASKSLQKLHFANRLYSYTYNDRKCVFSPERSKKGAGRCLDKSFDCVQRSYIHSRFFKKGMYCLSM